RLPTDTNQPERRRDTQREGVSVAVGPAWVLGQPGRGGGGLQTERGTSRGGAPGRRDEKGPSETIRLLVSARTGERGSQGDPERKRRPLCDERVHACGPRFDDCR